MHKALIADSPEFRSYRSEVELQIHWVDAKIPSDRSYCIFKRYIEVPIDAKEPKIVRIGNTKNTENSIEPFLLHRQEVSIHAKETKIVRYQKYFQNATELLTGSNALKS